MADKKKIEKKLNIFKEILNNKCYFCKDDVEAKKIKGKFILCEDCQKKYELVKETEKNDDKETLNIIGNYFDDKCLFCGDGGCQLTIKSKVNQKELKDYLPTCYNCISKYELFKEVEKIK
jgi:hypothetical protein